MNKALSQTTIGTLLDEGAVIVQTGPFGSQLHSYDYEPVGVPVVLTEAIGRRRLITDGVPRVSIATANRLSRHKLRLGDILFARRGAQATGLSALVEDEHAGWLCGSGAILLRVIDPNIDPTYLSFAFSADATIQWLKQHAVGAVMPNINETVLRGLEVSIPAFSEQRAIAEILGSLDEKIELNHRMNRTLESMARAVFHRWFLQNEDVDSWEVATLGDDNFFPLVPPGINIEKNQSVFYIATGDVQLGVITNETEDYVYSLPSRANMEPGNGRIWFAKMKDSRKYLWTFSEDNDWWRSRVLSTGFAGIQVVNRVYESYLYAFISSDKFDEEKNRLATGTTMQAVNTKAISSIILPIPPEAIVTQFDNIARPLYRKMWHNYLESRTLASLRDSLLPKLMRGEVRLKDVEDAQ